MDVESKIVVALPALGRHRQAVLERLDEAEDVLAERLDPSRAVRELAKRWRCARVDARAYVSAVTRRWALESELGTESRQSRRDGVRSALRTIVERSMDDRSFNHSISAINLLCELDGLKAEEKIPDLAKLFAAAKQVPRSETETKILTRKLRNTNE